jgi:hypothetical protein
MISNNQYQGVTSFSNAFFYILSVDFSGAVSRFPIQSFAANTATKGFPLQSGLGQSVSNNI